MHLYYAVLTFSNIELCEVAEEEEVEEEFTLINYQLPDQYYLSGQCVYIPTQHEQQEDIE